MHDFRHGYVDMYAHFLSMIFQCFQNFSGSYNFMFKNSIKMYISDLYSFVFPSQRQNFTIYIGFKETLVLNFSYKLFNISPYFREIASLVCQQENKLKHAYVHHFHNLTIKL